jgi:hypothetical protein
MVRRQLVDALPSEASTFAKSFAETVPISLSSSGGLVSALRESGKSLVRFGDGEALALLGKPIWFQRPDATLRSGLFEAFFGLSRDVPYSIAISGHALRSVDDLRSGSYDVGGSIAWKMWRKLRGLETLARHLDPGREVYDMFPLREGRDDPRPLWMDDEAVVLVSNELAHSRLLAQDVFEGRTVHHVPVPERQVMDVFEATCWAINSLFVGRGLPTTTPILIAAGPAAKLVAMRFAWTHRAYDLGAVFGGHRPGLKETHLVQP